MQDTIDKMTLIRSRHKAAQDRQESYAEQHRREMEYKEDEKMFLQVLLCKGILWFGNKGKLSP